MERDTFIFRKKWYEAIKSLDDSTKASAFDCICQYALYHNTAEPTDQMVKMAMAFIVPELEADCEKWIEVKGKRSEAGKKHTGNQYTRKKQNGTNEANVPTMEQNGTNGTDNVYVNVNDNVNVLSSLPPTPPSARARLGEWIKSSDLCEWSYLQCQRIGLVIDLPVLLDEFYNGDLKVREDCEKSERMEVLRHFQSWLPKYLKAIKQERDGNTTPKQSNRGAKTDLNDIARSFDIGFDMGGSGQQ